ncbi:glucose-1-phosphate thymidylyltransferase [Scopulibacillus darangshiensis]|uniref:Glucose-1-phosphate thymidylyltransferase n=1 Tax=Scopulibacillus darangshiensis TaxID=442528 RepID=A0A4R2NFK1_9BACL|nr:glucose-1-phosphate thymidylyltransferase RfbA [Scopulibacillus darangshiensis]TCP19968.1 glucose-1-phosphate thymidylyltransferase [Scopulibacillus darangshiensis]
MKGIVLAGGNGTRLYPLTLVNNKHLLPVYQKPMIYYPLSVLMLSGIRDILLITTKEDQPRFEELLGNGSELGINIQYAVQEEAKGIAEAFIIGETFIGNDDVALILGDNIFYGQGFTTVLRRVMNNLKGATVFGQRVRDPERFGVVEFDQDRRVKSLEEKPIKPKSDFAVTGLYFYDHHVVEYAKELSPSERGELEITDINRLYLEKGQLSVELLGRGFVWMDVGTHQFLHEASEFMKNIELRQGFKVACLEEIAYYMGTITKEQLIRHAQKYKNNEYGTYLFDIAKHKHVNQYWDSDTPDDEIGWARHAK